MWKPIDNLGVHLNQAQFLMNVTQINDIFSKVHTHYK